MKSIYLIAAVLVAALTWPAGAEDRVVYRSRIAEGSAAQWTASRISVAPKGSRRFLGMFGGRTSISLRLPDLPAHRLLRVRCTIFQIYSLDGNHPKDGPDYWGIALGGGPELLRTTFHFAHAWDPSNHPQSFPDEYPIDHPAGTGALELGSLGFRFEQVKIEPQASQSDMVYQLDLVFPHDAPEVELQFWSEYNGALSDEAWGIESVEVEALPEFAQKTDTEMRQLWSDLLAAEPARAAAALWQLASCGPKTTEFVARQLGGDDSKVAGLIRDLKSDDIITQEKARREIDRLEPQALPALRRALTDPATPEHLREEFGGLVADIKAESSLYLSRVGHLLRVLNSSASRTLLASLTGVPLPGEVPGPFARLRWHAVHAIAEDPWALRSAFTPDGKKLVTVGADGARTWDVETGRLLHYFVALRGRSLALSPDGTLALVGTKASQLGLWNLTTGKLVSVLRGHRGEVWGAGFLADSKHFITGASDGLRWWDAGDPVASSSTDLIAATRHLAVSPDGTTIAVAECDNDHKLVTIRESANGKLRRTLTEFSDTITSLSFSHNGQLLAVATYADGVKVFAVSDGGTRYAFAGASPKNESAVFSPDDRYICVGGGGGGDRSPEAQAARGVRLYRLSDGAEIWRTDRVAKSCLSVAFSPDGRLIAGTDAAHNVYLWEVFRAPVAGK